jgi:hypothetical protein
VSEPVEPPLPAHRVALRMLLVGAPGGAFGGAGLFLLFLPLTDMLREDLVAILATVVALVLGGAILGGGVTLLIELARFTQPALRAPLLVLLSVTAPLLPVAAFMWVATLSRGLGPEAALERTFDVLRDATTDRKSQVVIAFFAAVSALVGAARVGGLPGALGRALRLRHQVALAAALGPLGLAGFHLAHPIGTSEARALTIFLTSIGPALAVGLRLGDRLERRALDVWARRRAREDG